MSLNLPKPIADYFAAGKGAAADAAECFTEDVIVKDEGHTYYGLTAVKKWKAGASKKYTYTSEPFAAKRADGKTVISSRLIGNFPGSPVDLRFFFGLEGDKISFLEIIP